MYCSYSGKECQLTGCNINFCSLAQYSPKPVEGAGQTATATSTPVTTPLTPQPISTQDIQQLILRTCSPEQMQVLKEWINTYSEQPVRECWVEVPTSERLPKEDVAVLWIIRGGDVRFVLGSRNWMGDIEHEGSGSYLVSDASHWLERATLPAPLTPQQAQEIAGKAWDAANRYRDLCDEYPGDAHLFPEVPNRSTYLSNLNLHQYTHVTVIMPDRRNEALKTAHEAIEWYWNNTKPDNEDWSAHHDMAANALNEIEQIIGNPRYNRDKDPFIDTYIPF